MKGISTIIAIILMLTITIALAGMAWTFIASYLAGRVGVEVADSYCTGGTTANLVLRNIGTDPIGPNTITVRRTSPAPAAGTPDTCCAASIDPGTTGIYTDGTCTTAGVTRTCVYRVIPPRGPSLTASVYCTG